MIFDYDSWVILVVSASPPPRPAPTATATDRCGGSSLFSLCTSGSGFTTWGAGFGTDLAAGRDLPRMAFERETPRRWESIENYMATFGADIPARYIEGFGSHARLPALTDALLARGWSDVDVAKYLGGKFRRALGAIWGS